MKPKEAKAYYNHKKRHAPDVSALVAISTVQDLEQRISFIESNLRSPLRKQMDKEQRQRSSIDAQVALETYKEAIRRLTT
jgi:ATP adenylyltransferase/5',5'''-P-1,P-4-tetraphosphate phosphorylase II